jgi:hypothetical protein
MLCEPFQDSTATIWNVHPTETNNPKTNQDELPRHNEIRAQISLSLSLKQSSERTLSTLLRLFLGIPDEFIVVVNLPFVVVVVVVAFPVFCYNNIRGIETRSNTEDMSSFKKATELCVVII